MFSLKRNNCDKALTHNQLSRRCVLWKWPKSLRCRLNNLRWRFAVFSSSLHSLVVVMVVVVVRGGDQWPWLHLSGQIAHCASLAVPPAWFLFFYIFLLLQNKLQQKPVTVLQSWRWLMNYSVLHLFRNVACPTKKKLLKTLFISTFSGYPGELWRIRCSLLSTNPMKRQVRSV